MDVYSITEKGADWYRHYSVLSPERDLQGFQDTLILGLVIGGTISYEELVNWLVGPETSLFPTKGELRQSLRRVFEAGLIDRLER